MNNKLSIFDQIKIIKNGSISFYKQSDEAIKKQISPFMLNRWLSCSDSPLDIILVNETINSFLFPLHKHPDLLYKLLCASVDDSKSKCNWIKKKSKKTSSASVKIVCEYFQCNTHSAELYIKSIKLDSLIEMAESLGYDKNIIDAIKKEHT